jgi:hypothetical protein
LYQEPDIQHHGSKRGFVQVPSESLENIGDGKVNSDLTISFFTFDRIIPEIKIRLQRSVIIMYGAIMGDIVGSRFEFDRGIRLRISNFLQGEYIYG